MREQIRARARELGFDDCRFTSADPPGSSQAFLEWISAGKQAAMGYLERNAPKRVDPSLVLPGVRSVITLATSYTPPDETDRHTQHPTFAGVFARYSRFADYHDVLADRLKQLTAYVDCLGTPGTRSLWYVDTGPILERDLGQRAGLGFVGKHTNLISRSLGNWFFISEILTPLAFEPDSPEHNRCGSCTRCLTACPTGAITAPFQLDARLCISYLTIELKGPIPSELRTAIGNRIYGCDDCLEVCPWNRFSHSARLMRPHFRPDLTTADLVELLSLDDSAFKQRFAGTPILRTKRRGLLRNVCVALGNTGDSRALPALEKAGLDPEPLIAEHARWAIDQITKRILLPNPAG